MTCDLRLVVVNEKGIRTLKTVTCDGEKCLRGLIFKHGGRVVAETQKGVAKNSKYEVLVEGDCKKDNC